MAYYYKYKFVSPDPVFARVKEELKSYFDTGAVDDVLFPLWTEDCLKKLGRSSWKIVDALLFIDNFTAKLPPDFVAVRECWLTSNVALGTYRKPGAYYQQITTVLNRPYDPCNPALSCDPCNPDILRVVTKTTEEGSQCIDLKWLLKPGNIAVHDDCDAGCLNLNYSSCGPDTFDIRDGKLITNFREGDVFLIYYSSQSDENGYQLIPDNYRVQEFIRAFLKAKVFEMLTNQITDETFNQMQNKWLTYKQMADEAYIMADIEIKKETIYKRAYKIRKELNRFDPYERMMRGRRRVGPLGPSSSWGV